MVLVGLQSCNQDIFYDNFIDLSERSWSYDNVLLFETEITDTLQIYDIYLNIKHTKDYAYRNLYVLVYTTFPSGERLEQRLRLDLADKSGKWRGSCSGSECLAQFPIQLNAFFNRPGIYVFELEQNMRLNPLSEILGAGISLYESELPKQ